MEIYICLEKGTLYCHDLLSQDQMPWNQDEFNWLIIKMSYDGPIVDFNLDSCILLWP